MKNNTIKIESIGNTRVKTILDEQTRITTVEINQLDEYGEILVFARGKAKWNPIDYFDPAIGEMIALGRAMSKYGRKLAAWGESQSCSRGEQRRRERIDRETREFGKIFYYNYGQSAQKYDLRPQYVSGLVNLLRQSPTASTEQLAQDTPAQVPDLRTLIDENQKKLEVAQATETEAGKGAHI